MSASSFAESFITPDFKLHDPDRTLLRRTINLDADTLGNFYAAWRQGINEAVGLDGKFVVTKIRYDGTVEKAFVTIGCDTTPGFDGASSISVDPSGGRFAVSFTRYYYQHQSPTGVATALPPKEHVLAQLFDSTGEALTSERWADSLTPDVGAGNLTAVITSRVFAAMWREFWAFSFQYMQQFDLSGQRLGVQWKYDSCEAMECWASQTSRADANPRGFVVTWDEIIIDSGTEFRPVFRIFDSLGAPVTPVVIGAREPGHDDLCASSAPGLQSGFAPDVALADNGEFMLVWSSCDGPYYGAKPWGQVYYPDGTPKSGLILLADTDPSYVPWVHVAWGDDGNFYAAWADGRDCAPSRCFAPENVYVQRVSPTGELLGPNYIINDVLRSCHTAFALDIAVSKGRACVVWQDWRDSYLYGDGEMFGQVVSLDLIGTYLHGDVNLDYKFTSADIIYLVNYVFKSGQRPLPGRDYGDVTGDCVTSAADIIHYVNFVFKEGAELREPCQTRGTGTRDSLRRR